MNVDAARPGRGSEPGAEGASIVTRRRLVTRLVAGGEPAVVSIVAPAGFGKSTVLSQWDDADPRPFARLLLAERHNDPVVLTAAIADAVAALVPVGDDVYSALNGSSEGAQQAAVPRLLAALAAGSSALVLALDDLHVITAPDSAAVIGTIADELPPETQLAIASRTEPPLRLGRLRANRELIELGAGDLAMTRTEAEEMLRACGLRLEANSVDVLMKRTEGWPAALYLAALSLGEAADPDEQARRFAGDDRLVVEYLRDEFIANLSAETASFLTRTSILDELSGDVCDAVLQSEGSASTLRDLARSNALVKPLDSKDQAFRYHSLLRDTLAAELHGTSPREESDLHDRAARWFAERADYDRAVPHAIAGGDADSAAALIWSQAAVYSSTGRAATLRRWLELCDHEQLEISPELCLVRATAALGSGKGADASHWTARAVAELDGSTGRAADTIRVFAAAIDALGAAWDGVVAMRRHATDAFELLPEANPWRSSCRLIEGASLHLTGEPALARAALEDAARLALLGAPGINTVALAQLSLMALDDDDLVEAGRLSSESVARLALNGLANQPTQALVPAAAALVAAQRGEPDAAGRQISHADALLSKLTDFSPWYRAEARIALGRALVRLDDIPAGRRQLAEAGRDMRRTPDAPVLAEWLARAEEEADSATLGGRWPLTPAELRLLQYLPTHLSFPEISEELFLSPNTVKTHARSIYMKMGVSSRAEAVRSARSAGLLGNGGDSPPPA